MQEENVRDNYENVFEYDCYFNPLVPELSAQGTLQKIQDLNGHPVCCIFLASDFR
jgi:hypothetical protein